MSAPGAFGEFRRWFWRPPRAHGEIEAERRVSFLELFSDLAWVVVIAQAARALAASISGRGYLEFLVVFGVIWVAWANGTLYYELHGREDGRTRTFVFVQVAILALLAVFTAEAARGSGQAFAVVYIGYLGVMTWLWYAVRRQDREEYMANTARYLVAMGVSIAVMAVSIALPPDARLLLWAVFCAGWAVLMLLMGWNARRGSATGMVPTDAMVERFDLLVIIVLGEVVTGVVGGLGGVQPDPLTLATALVGLLVGFGLWWIFFDVGGRRLPRAEGLAITGWIQLHLPVAVAIVGAGAAMPSLIDAAHEAKTPAGTAWLLAGSVALALVSLAAMTRTLRDWDRHVAVYRPLGAAMLAGALVALLAGWLRPAPWLLAFVLVGILAGAWAFAVVRLFKTGLWSASGSADEVSAPSGEGDAVPEAVSPA